MSFAVSGYAKDIKAKPGMSLGAGRFAHLHAHAAGQKVVHEAALLLAKFSGVRFFHLDATSASPITIEDEFLLVDLWDGKPKTPERR